MRVIFLDVDGVLNADDTKDRFAGCIGIERKKVKLLKKIVEKTKAKIVIASTWRCHREFLLYLSERLEKEGVLIYGITPEILWQRRETEIENWLAFHETEDFVILDDECFWNKYHEHWIDTSPEGLTEDIVEKVADYFATGKARNV